MHITKFQVEGFRGFKERMELNLHPNVNVLVGVNGAGKSSLLDGMDMFLFRFKQNFNIDVGYNYWDNYINDLKEECNFSIHLNHNDLSLEWNACQAKLGALTFNIKPATQQILNNWQQQIISSSSKHKLPIIQYYQASRIFKNAEKKSLKKLYTPYDETFEQDNFTFLDFENWFINAKNFENHIRLSNDNNYRSGYLLAIEAAFISFFNKIEEGSAIYSKLDISYGDTSDFTSSDSNVPVLVVNKNDVPIKLSKLSDGEKMLLVILGNIVKDLCNISMFTKGPINSINSSPEEILSGPGIVLIDEIELHLHPAWQRNIIPALTATFPNIQFIVTTHSPQVLSNVDSESIFIIEDYQIVAHTPHTKGRDSNSILWEIYGVEKHPDSTKTLLKRFYSQLEDNLEAAQTSWQELEATLGESDEEVIRAKYHLDIELRLLENNGIA